jgi:hypothetical protein
MNKEKNSTNYELWTIKKNFDRKIIESFHCGFCQPWIRKQFFKCDNLIINDDLMSRNILGVQPQKKMSSNEWFHVERELKSYWIENVRIYLKFGQHNEIC